MKRIIEDENRFDELQRHVLRTIVESIREDIKDLKLSEDEKFDLTSNIAFSVAAIIDASRIMELDGQEVLPILAFAKTRGGEELITSDGGSWMHEYAAGMVDDVFNGE